MAPSSVMAFLDKSSLRRGHRSPASSLTPPPFFCCENMCLLCFPLFDSSGGIFSFAFVRRDSCACCLSSHPRARVRDKERERANAAASVRFVADSPKA